MTSFWTSQIKVGSVTVDIGANAGEYIEHVLEFIGTSGHIYAIEPGPQLYKALCDKYLGNDQITCFNFGISNGIYSKVVGHYKHWILVSEEEHPDKIANPASYNITHDNAKKEKFTCNFVTLDSLKDYMPRYNEIKFLKIDVDGYELKVLQGAEKLVQELRPSILIELSPDNMALVGDNFEDSLRVLHEYDYTFFHGEDGLSMTDSDIKHKLYVEYAGQENIGIDILCIPI